MASAAVANIMSTWTLGLLVLAWAARARACRPTRSPNGVPLPSVMHAVLRTPPSTRTLIVGDVHGCLDELLELLADARYDPKADQLVLVGDLVNKGPKSAQVVRWARETGAHCVRGNHDDALLSVHRRSGKWASAEPPPSYAYARELSEADFAFLEGLPYSLALPEHGVLVVHAGLVPAVPLDAQLPADLFKIRDVRPSSAEPGAPLEGLEKPAEGSASWASRYEGELGHVVFGHDAKRGLQRERFATGLDTGCCYGKALTALVLPGHELISTPARRAYEEPGRKRTADNVGVADAAAQSGASTPAARTL